MRLIALISFALLAGVSTVNAFCNLMQAVFNHLTKYSLSRHKKQDSFESKPLN